MLQMYAVPRDERQTLGILGFKRYKHKLHVNEQRPG